MYIVPSAVGVNEAPPSCTFQSASEAVVGRLQGNTGGSGCSHVCSTCDSTVVNSAKVPDVPAGLAGGGRTSDHEFVAWMGGSAGGSGGTACC